MLFWLLACQEDYDKTTAINPDKDGNFNHPCSGAGDYSRALDLELEPGTMPPRIAVWSHVSDEIRTYQETFLEEDRYTPVDWVVSTGIPIGDNGKALITCFWFEWVDVVGEVHGAYYYDRIKVVVG